MRFILLIVLIAMAACNSSKPEEKKENFIPKEPTETQPIGCSDEINKR